MGCFVKQLPKNVHIKKKSYSKNVQIQNIFKFKFCSDLKNVQIQKMFNWKNIQIQNLFKFEKRSNFEKYPDLKFIRM